MTQSTLAEETQMSQAEISKFETGMRIPTDEQVRRIASRLEFPNEFFCLSESKRDFGSGCIYYHRKRESAREGKLRELLALINVRRIQIKQLLPAVKTKNEYEFESLDIDEHAGATGVAQSLRALWKIPPGPVSSVIQVIENAGGIILRSNFGTDKIDALSQWLPGMPPIFLINDRIPTDRMRWTLIHELGHIIMHRFPTDNMEREADDFAAEFLMPANQIKPQLHSISLARLASLKPHWRVAMSALLRRAADLGMITPRAKKYLWMQMGMHGYKKHEPVEIPPEEPTLLSELLDFHQETLGHDACVLSQIMRVKESELRRTYLRKEKPGGMRLIRAN
jgi:Zn-dependent peptidase ImmA (M78 family)/transcriptional regulator with XRE-family HTH domain